jgi:hypothetical protein
MSDDDVGYCKPPKHTRFKKGVSGNLKGRPKRKPAALGDIVRRVLNARVEYREGGRSKSATRRGLTIETLVKKARKGDVTSAELLLDIRSHAKKFGDAGVSTIRFDGWLPDHPGQTAEEKMHEFSLQKEGGGSDAEKRKSAEPPKKKK